MFQIALSQISLINHIFAEAARTPFFQPKDPSIAIGHSIFNARTTYD